MNYNLLKELMKQSETECGFNTDKFAELIVRQCMALCEDVTERNDPAIACYYEIKQHFGVEDRAIPILSADEQALLSGIESSKLFTIEAAKKAFGVKE